MSIKLSRIERERETDRQTGRQTDGQTGRQTKRPLESTHKFYSI